MAIKLIDRKLLILLGSAVLLSHGYSKVEAANVTTVNNNGVVYQDQNTLTSQILATPTGKPNSKPTPTPTPKYSSKPSAKPTAKASSKPSAKPTPDYSSKPSPKETETPQPKSSESASPKASFVAPVITSVTGFFEGLFSKISSFFKF